MLDVWNSWESDVNNHIRVVEKKLLPISFNNKDLLMKALMRRAKLEEIQKAKKGLSTDIIENYNLIGSQDGLDTIGDIILDYAIIKRCTKPNSLPREINDAREKYGKIPASRNFQKTTFNFKIGLFGERMNGIRIAGDCLIIQLC